LIHIAGTLIHEITHILTLHSYETQQGKRANRPNDVQAGKKAQRWNEKGPMERALINEKPALDAMTAFYDALKVYAGNNSSRSAAIRSVVDGFRKEAEDYRNRLERRATWEEEFTGSERRRLSKWK
jgi:hypothetical protein